MKVKLRTQLSLLSYEEQPLCNNKKRTLLNCYFEVLNQI